MTHASDGFRQGKAFIAQYAGTNQLATTSGGVWPPGGPGAVMSPIFFYSVVPLTLNASNIAASQTPAAAGNLTLTAGTGITSTTWFSQTVLAIDVPRALRVVSAGNDTGITFTVTGYDGFGQPQTETITGANAGTATGKKAFKYVYTVAASAAAAGAVTVGTTDVLGLPYVASDAVLVTPKWATTLAQDAGTFVAADATSPATATTGDTRGTYVPSSASNGTRRLMIEIRILDPDTRVGLFGVTPA